MSGATHVDVAIVGAGFGGLGAAIHLERAGFDSFLMFEKANDVGGRCDNSTREGTLHADLLGEDASMPCLMWVRDP
jgi:cation diffusion facilitator CzcD-associated flavoprotein CzcO